MKRAIAVLAILFLAATVALAAEYQYVKPELFRQWLESGKKTIIVDIQVPAEYEKRHFKDSLATGAYPVKSDQERQRLDQTLAIITASPGDVVIVCPRGGGGAKNTFDYLKGKGIAEKRLYILEKGMEGWPYPELCATGR